MTGCLVQADKDRTFDFDRLPNYAVRRASMALQHCDPATTMAFSSSYLLKDLYRV